MSDGQPGAPGEASSYGHGGSGGAGGRGGDPSGTGGPGGRGGTGGRLTTSNWWGRLAPPLAGIGAVIVFALTAGVGYLSYETYHGNTPAHQAAVRAATQASSANAEIQTLESTLNCEKRAFNQVLGELLLHQPITAPPKC